MKFIRSLEFEKLIVMDYYCYIIMVDVFFCEIILVFLGEFFFDIFEEMEDGLYVYLCVDVDVFVIE